MKFRYALITVLALCTTLLAVQQSFAGTPAQQCVVAANDLQQKFDTSILKGWQLKFFARGENCDVLHVESYTKLNKQMMEALASGTMVYGKVLPGGVNSFAFNHGFKDTVYANNGNSKFISYGPHKLTKSDVKKLRKCSDGSAPKIK